MNDLINNILRGGVSSVMYVFLLFTLTNSRFGRKTTLIVAILVFVLNMASTLWFYVYGDLTALSRFTIVLFIVIGLAIKPLTKLNFMQWSFTFLTTINIAMIIIILSFHLGKLFPEPQSANTILRLVFYFIVIFLFQRFLLPSYRSAINNWPIFSVLIICIFINLSYYFYVTDDIQNTLTTFKWPLILLVMFSLAAYGTVFYSLKKFAAMYSLEAENLKIQNDRGILYQAASTMAERLQLMDEIVTQHSLASHDRRHFNGMIQELLEQGEIGEAVACLRKQNETKIPTSRIYCENKAINAATSYYVDMAEQRRIQTKVNLSIPMDVKVDSMELALVVSNLFENAIHGVDLLPEGQEKYIHFTCLQVGRLLLEISNPCIETVVLNKDGLPFTTHSGHGVGTRSIIAFAAKHNAELLYNVENGLFRVRLLV